MDERRVGVLGGGQLGRMMAEAGHRLGIHLNILDPGKPILCNYHLHTFHSTRRISKTSDICSSI